MSVTTSATNPDPASSAILDVRIQFAPNLPLVRLVGELDLDSHHLLTDALDAIEAAHCPGDLVVVDLEGVTFCDVAGLRALEHCGHALQLAGKQLMLYHPPRAVTRLMTMTGVAQGFATRS
ncbi:STAS domain-containing protein [Nocardioides sp. MH1]|uniref:STAS domain-containing protein n=1 Tax=Nocardioides sp. MH1 TaxID=3242490 RepID=UPI003521434E